MFYIEILQININRKFPAQCCHIGIHFRIVRSLLCDDYKLYGFILIGPKSIFKNLPQGLPHRMSCYRIGFDFIKNKLLLRSFYDQIDSLSAVSGRNFPLDPIAAVSFGLSEMLMQSATNRLMQVMAFHDFRLSFIDMRHSAILSHT